MNNDSRYINIHLNTPGYRTYRPAWRMISWHVKGVSAKENDRKQYVLDRLTHAQKNANTTRGSTPGLINPALGEVPGNRIALPELAIKKRGPQRQKANAFNTSATQSAQPGQAPQNPGVSGAAQAPRARKARKEQARKTPQAPAQAPPQAAQARPAGSSNAASAPFPVALGTIGTPSQTLSMTAAATVLHYSTRHSQG